MIKIFKSSGKIKKRDLVVMTKKGTVKKATMPKKTTLEDVLDVIKKWEKSNNVMFFGGFVSFDKDFNVNDDRLICYGDKESIKISLDEFNKIFKSDKNKFINW
jgi:hypothetical protein